MRPHDTEQSLFAIRMALTAFEEKWREIRSEYRDGTADEFDREYLTPLLSIAEDYVRATQATSEDLANAERVAGRN